MNKIALISIILGVIIIIPAALVGLILAAEGVAFDGRVAHIHINGIILTESSDDIFSSGGTSSAYIVRTLEDIAEDDSIDAVLIEINSPGGSGVASDEIAQAIEALDKPTVAYIREVGASGSYWVASSADKIYANRFSTVGSIGVIASYLEFSGLLEDYNVSYQRFVAGDRKDFGSPYREPTAEEAEDFQAILDELHSYFIAEVAENRNMSYDDVAALADGFIFTGSEAVRNGLVDEIGGKKEAVAYLEQELNTTVTLVEYKPEVGFFDSFAGVLARQSFAIGKGIGSVLQPEFYIRT